VARLAFGLVYSGSLNTHLNEKVALKQVRSGGWSENASAAELKALAELCGEASVLWSVPHTNIVRLYGAHFDRNGNFYIVTEFCNLGSLLDLCAHGYGSKKTGTFESGTSAGASSGQYVSDSSDEEEDGIIVFEPTASQGDYTTDVEGALVKDFVELGDLLGLLIGVTRGMHAMHAHGIAHRDLAARNVLVHKARGGVLTAKVADVGLAHNLYENDDEYSFSTGIRPVRWTAPEGLASGELYFADFLPTLHHRVFQCFQVCVRPSRIAHVVFLTGSSARFSLKSDGRDTFFPCLT
jgi:serine/threonine protein kinase